MNGNEHDEDLAFVCLCKQGDADAFEALVRRHQKKMLNIAYRMTGSYEEACEVVQDAFVSAYKNIHSFEERSGFATWLTSIVMNYSRNRIKQLRTRTVREVRSMDDPVTTEDGFLLVEPRSPEPSPLDRVENQELGEAIQRCIGKLNEDFRAVLVLRDVEGCAYDEIGTVLRINPGTVKSRIARARDSVRECLKRALGRLT